MSTVTVSVGNSRNDFQLQRRKTSIPSSIVNSHRSKEMRGVGPADKTGKSVVRYCPGGNSASVALRLPKNPREIIAICPPYAQSLIRQATILNHKICNSIYANTTSQIRKDKRTMRTHSQRIHLHHVEICAHQGSQIDLIDH